ncbi:MAG: rhomboid family intramembrane serine protease [Rhodobacteraceae bacterium]|nr:rhomboid family intramembrane serine protease [Paracoccaceae bacterium]
MINRFGHEPVFGRVPATVLLLAAAVGAVEVILAVLELNLWEIPQLAYPRVEAVKALSFDSQLFRTQFELGFIFDSASLRLVTFPFIHLNFIHSLFSVVFILVLGSLLCRLVHAMLLPTTFFLASAAGALGFALLPGSEFPLLGATPGYLGILGLLGGLLLMMHGRENPAATPAMVAFPFFLMGLKLVQDVAVGIPGYWSAHAVGFAVGLLISLAVVSGSLSAIRSGLARLLRN